MRLKYSFGPTLAIMAVLSGCATAPTWTNRGHQVVESKASGRISCAEDAQIVDGERIPAAICGAPVSGWLGDGEPKIQFGAWNMRIMGALASETTEGVGRPYGGKVYFLKCDPTYSTDKKVEIGRDCKVTVNGQLLISAEFIFK